MGFVADITHARTVASIFLRAIVSVLLIPAFLISRPQRVVDVHIDLRVNHGDIGQLFYEDKSQYPGVYCRARFITLCAMPGEQMSGPTCITS